MEVQKQKQKQKRQDEEDMEEPRQQRDNYSRSPPPSASLPSSSPRSQHHRHLLVSKSSPPSLPPADSLPDSPTVSSISDSHGSSPHTVTPTASLAVATPSAASVVTTKAETPFRVPGGVANGDVEEQKVGESRRRLRQDLFSLRESSQGTLMRKALLGFRVSAFVFCLISLSIMATDKHQGWAFDSFYKYIEFRYCMAANVIGCIYSGLQICDLAYVLSTRARRSRQNLRYFLDFALDQMIAYLLASASTSASVRVDDWLSNWGSDKFPNLARASASLSFLSFASFAFCSLASGYAVCTLW